MKRVILESPYRGNRERHMKYLDRAIRDSLERGEAPFASHRIYPGALSDDAPDERKLGMEAGWTWLDVVDAVVVYDDHGVTSGMLEGIVRAGKSGLPIERRQIGVQE